MKPPSRLAAEVNDRLVYFYGQTDGTMAFPNSAEGDILKLVHELLPAVRGLVRAAEGADDALLHPSPEGADALRALHKVLKSWRGSR